ncbi:hypothetical protein [uncultured Tenacibaculum sp.]|uniref:hypothetical protein n=1 Tax=uncultured Tenacibaculum sp. TaxID=174713 RepID=UPI0026041FCD|nr:hypothetical protein [uncultured Tenacibaculum sp.]
MKRINYILYLSITLLLINCSNEKNQFPTDKRYWDVNDYDEVVRTLRFGYESDEKLPNFKDPKTRIVVEKLTDEKNYKVILDDKKLGLKHKNKVAEKFFNKWKDMTRIYESTDRRDMYLYDQELLATWHFGLGLQLRYFKLGNDNIKENADDPNSKTVENNINSNINTLIKNYLIYLDQINNENSFTEEGKSKLAKGIDSYFTQLITLYPNADYSKMRHKSELMLKKANSNKIKSSLNKLIAMIDSKKE